MTRQSTIVLEDRLDATYGPLPAGHESILLVDDDEDLVYLGREMLGYLGYEVSSTTSSAEALSCFRAEPGRFDLVITDERMPGMTGLELARELVGIRADISIILCTGYSEAVDTQTTKDLGIRNIMIKPFSLRTLADAVRGRVGR